VVENGQCLRREIELYAEGVLNEAETRSNVFDDQLRRRCVNRGSVFVQPGRVDAGVVAALAMAAIASAIVVAVFVAAATAAMLIAFSTRTAATGVCVGLVVAGSYIRNTL
jgi:hypothetical protein